MHSSEACTRCGASAVGDGNFCASCGHALSELRGYAVAPPRLFGVLSPHAFLGAAAALLLGAVVAFAMDSPVAGIVLLALAIALGVLFFGAAEESRDRGLAGALLTANGRVREWTRFVTGSTEAWTSAGRNVLRLRGELRRLDTERRRTLLELGEASYREDEDAITALRRRMWKLDTEIDLRERARHTVLARARERVADERVAVHRTEVLKVEDFARRRRPAQPWHADPIGSRPRSTEHARQPRRDDPFGARRKRSKT